MSDPDPCTYMSVPIAFSSGQESKSFEELRIDDYLKAYTTTGRPPQPFQPGISAPGVVPFEPRKWTPITSMEELPTSQAFHNLKNEGTAAAATGDSEYHSITFDVRYSGFSFEELRCYAYSKGRRLPPSNIPFEEFTVNKAMAPSSTSTPSVQGEVPGETMTSISCQREYSRHSFEELRVGYLKAGREVTSDEIERGASGLAPAQSIPALSLSAPTSAPVFSFGQSQQQQPSSLFTPPAPTPTNPFAMPQQPKLF